MPAVDLEALLSAVAEQANAWGGTSRWSAAKVREMHALRAEAPALGSTPWYEERLFSGISESGDWDVMSVDFALDVLVSAGALEAP